MPEGVEEPRTRRPMPPRDLTQEQAKEWRAIVKCQDVDWATEDRYPLLVQLCRHITNARDLAKTLESEVTASERLALMRAQVAQTKEIASLMTKLCLTPQSVSNGGRNKPESGGPLPWDD